jgi:hypothetical protein
MSPRRFTLSHTDGNGGEKHLFDISHLTVWCGAFLTVCGCIAAIFSASNWVTGKFDRSVRPIAHEEAVTVVQSHVEGWDAKQHVALQSAIDTARHERLDQIKQLSDRLDSQYAAIQLRLDQIIVALSETAKAEKAEAKRAAGQPGGE